LGVRHGWWWGPFLVYSPLHLIPPASASPASIPLSQPSILKGFLQISAGELSLDSATMEVQLSRVFQTANYWNALILLDEADVYLE